MKPEYIKKAKELLTRGYMPIPLNGKAPIPKGWERAIYTPDEIDSWATKDYMQNLGLRTGDNGLIVLDFDGMAGYEAFIVAMPDLAESYTVKTGSGKGMHVYLIVAKDTRARAGLKLPGGTTMEIKGVGGQVVIPPSIHPETHQPYTVFKALEAKRIDSLQPFLDWIGEFQPKYEPTPRESIAHTEAGDHAAYAKQTLANMAADLARMGDITNDYQNTTCNKMAWKLAHFVRRGDLSESECRNALEGAMRTNGYVSAFGQRAFDKTFDSGFNDGYGDHEFEPEIYLKSSRAKKSSTDLDTAPIYETPAPNADSESIPVPVANPLDKYGKARAGVLATYVRRLQDNEPPVTPPMHGPLSALYDFGGYCRVIPPGRLVFIVGSSGTGKTSMLETITDRWTPMGYNLVVWSPEWSADEMIERAVQRQGGATLEQLYLHQIALSDMANGYRTQGRLLDQRTIDQSLSTSEDIAASFGEVFYLGARELNSLNFKTILPNVARDLYAEQKRRYNAVLLDYAQLMHACEDKDVSMYQVLMRIKQACLLTGMVGVIATQTTKADTRSGSQGTLLDASSARFVNEDAANLFITLNLEKEPPDGGDPYSTGVLNVTKNSIGRKGKKRVFTELNKLAWLDKVHDDQDMSMYEEKK